MAEIGKITPAYHDGEAIREWRVPILAFMLPNAKPLDVVNVYEDEGYLCIDVKEQEDGE